MILDLFAAIKNETDRFFSNRKQKNKIKRCEKIVRLRPMTNEMA
jgi:hypothetical protein